MDLFYRKFGVGSPLLILHGLFGLSDNWISIGKQLSKYFEVYLLDLRNHGQSPRSHEFSHEIMAEDVADFCEKLKLRNCIVMGHSMGGKVAMCLSNVYPELLAKLIVVDIAPREYFIYDYLQKMIMTIRDTDLKKFSSRQELENYIINKVDDIRIMQFLSKNIQRNSNNIFEWKFYAEGIIENIAYMGHAVKKYNTFTKPTIFIRGGKSKFITENDYSIIADYYPQATIQVIPNAGHWVHADEPVEFMKQILTFLGLEKFL